MLIWHPLVSTSVAFFFSSTLSPSVISSDADICAPLCRRSLSSGWRRACAGMIAFSMWETTTGAKWRFYWAPISFINKKKIFVVAALRVGFSSLGPVWTCLMCCLYSVSEFFINLHPVVLLQLTFLFLMWDSYCTTSYATSVFDDPPWNLQQIPECLLLLVFCPIGNVSTSK